MSLYDVYVSVAVFFLFLMREGGQRFDIVFFFTLAAGFDHRKFAFEICAF